MSREPEHLNEAKNSTEKERYLAFSLNEEEFAIPLLAVREVIALPDVTSIPFTPNYFLGIMNLRGQVISVLDLRIKFKMKKAEQHKETTVIIVDIGTVCLGVVVDSVNTVLSLGAKDIHDTPEIESSIGTEYITGITRHDDKLIVLMDVAKVLSVSDRQIVNKSASKPAA